MSFRDFDLTYIPSGTTGYDDLAPASHKVLIGDVSAQVADLGDVIRSKRAAGRPKDLAVLPLLVAHAETLGIRVERFPEPSDAHDKDAITPRHLRH